jgi:hypothetical protein
MSAINLQKYLSILCISFFNIKVSLIYSVWNLKLPLKYRVTLQDKVLTKDVLKRWRWKYKSFIRSMICVFLSF